MMLARKIGPGQLADGRLTVPGHYGANLGLKVTALVAGRVAGADSIDDMALLRHGGLPKLFTGTYAPLTLGLFLRKFAFGHVRQLDAVAARWLRNVAAKMPLLGGINKVALVDIDDTIKEVHGYQKQGSGYGYSDVRGLNAMIGTVTTAETAPVVVGSRLRKGPCGSPRGAGKFVADILATVTRLLSQDASGRVLLRVDSAFYSHAVVAAATRAGWTCRSRSGWIPTSNGRSRRSRRPRGRRSTTPTRCAAKRLVDGSSAQKSPKSPSSPSARRKN